jgi:anaerobic selenocysteine-containing dehydrogenase
MADFGALESNDIAGLAHARFIVNWGKDLSRSSVHVAALVRKARRNGSLVLSISPGGDGNEDFSDRTVRVHPGTDRFLAAAVIKLLQERGRIDPAMTGLAGNWPQFERLLESQGVQDLLERCGASANDLEEIHRLYSSPGPTATLIGWGLQRHAFGGENVRFINALALLSGNVGRRGGGSTFGISSMRSFNRSWASAPPSGSPRRTLCLPSIGREILETKDPPIKLIWANGCNVVNQAPEALVTARAFEQVPFKVVVDAFMTDTAERADLVLPCALMLEKEDLVGSFLHDYVSYARKVLDPPGEARSDFEILRDLGKRLDPPILIPEMDVCLSNALDSPFLDVSLEKMRETSHTRAKRPEIAFADLRFGHADGKYRFPEALHAEPSAPPDFPLRLLTLIRKEAIHSQILPEDHKPCPTVWVSPECPVWGEDKGEAEKDALLVSPLGRIRVKVRKCPGLHPEVVVYRRGDWMKLGGGANRLISARITDMGETAAFYNQHARLELC